MKRFLPILIGIIVGVVCARLGMWQLDRLGQRQERNRVREDRLAMEPLVLGATDALDAADTQTRQTAPGGQRRSAPDSVLGGVGSRDGQRPLAPASASDGAEGWAGRRAVARGRFDFARQTLEMARLHRGAPGALVMTPLITDDGTTVLVNRGWSYAADGRTVNLAALIEPDTATVTGVLLVPRPDALGVDPRDVIGDGAFPLILRRTNPPGFLSMELVPLDPPILTNGPHLSYAIQWFAFSAIALVGGVVLYVKTGRSPLS